MNPIEKLSEYFKKFPGIGERQAKRFVYYLLHQNPSYLNDLSSLITTIKKEISQCVSCYVFFQYNNQKMCEVCRDERTNQELLMIIEKDADYENIKRAGFYNGIYFILGGLVPIVEKDTRKLSRINELIKKVEEKSGDNNLKEIILALSLNPQGEHTDMYIREILSPLQEKHGFKISSMGRGLRTGLELEYSDSDTIKNALKNRQ